MKAFQKFNNKSYNLMNYNNNNNNYCHNNNNCSSNNNNNYYNKKLNNKFYMLEINFILLLNYFGKLWRKARFMFQKC